MASLKVLTLLCVALAATAVLGDGECRDGWKFYEGSCYGVFQDRDDWHDHDEYCNDLDGYLAVISSAEENQFVKDLLTEEIPDASGAGVWFGARFDSVFGGWKYYGRDTARNMDFTDWSPSYEMDKTKTDIFDRTPRVHKCGKMIGDENWAWTGVSCSEKQDYFICEKCPLKQKCSGGKCYSLQCRVDEVRDAADRCGYQGGRLAQINSAEEHKLVKDLLKDAAIPQHDMVDVVNGILIAGSDRKTEGEWVLPSDDGDVALSYDGWAESEPDNMGFGGRPEWCLALDPTRDFDFDDVSCMFDLPYICEFENSDTQDSAILG